MSKATNSKQRNTQERKKSPLISRVCKQTFHKLKTKAAIILEQHENSVSPAPFEGINPGKPKKVLALQNNIGRYLAFDFIIIKLFTYLNLGTSSDEREENEMVYKTPKGKGKIG